MARRAGAFIKAYIEQGRGGVAAAERSLGLPHSRLSLIRKNGTANLTLDSVREIADHLHLEAWQLVHQIETGERPRHTIWRNPAEQLPDLGTAERAQKGGAIVMALREQGLFEVALEISKLILERGFDGKAMVRIAEIFEREREHQAHESQTALNRKREDFRKAWERVS